MQRVFLALAAAAAFVSAKDSSGIKTSDGDLKITPPNGGTTIFTEPDGETSIQQILANLRETNAELGELKVFVEDKIAQDLQTERERSDQKFAETDDKFAEVDDAIADALLTVAQNAQTAKSTSEQFTNQAIASTVTPVVNQIKQDMTALETKINNEVGKKVDEVAKVVDDIIDALLGSNSGMPADSCAKIKEAQDQAADGVYWIKSQGSTVRVHCKKVGSAFVSMGGDGSSKAAAAADCEAHSLVENNDADMKWIDPDANSENTANAVQKKCVFVSCREIKDHTKTTKSGVYRIKPKDWTEAKFDVWCDMSKDGGGWTLTEMHTAGWNNQPIGRSMPDKGANEDQLMSRGDDFKKWKSGNMGDYASLGEKKINAIYHSHGESTIMRNWNMGKYFGNHNQPVNFYYQKKQPKKDWSIFHAIRNTQLWSGQTHSRRAWSSANDGFKFTYKDPAFNTDTSVYDPTKNQIKNQRGNRGYMYWWDIHTVTGNSGKSFRVSRHGIPGDPFGGCQWNFYFWGGNGQRSHGHCSRMRMSFYWLR